MQPSDPTFPSVPCVFQRKVIRYRSFAKGVSCLCCMGGNCHAVGHILDSCDCSCVVTSVVLDEEDRAASRRFKYLFFDGQRQFNKDINKGEKANGVPGSWDDFVRQWEDELRIQRGCKGSRLWTRLVEQTHDICRRFVCDKMGKCREEAGCGRSSVCGECFLRTGQWTQGHPFTPLRVQLQWINEFFAWVMQPRQEMINPQEVAAISMVTKDKRDTKTQLPVLPSGSLLQHGTPEESVFGYQNPSFPTTRRPVRRPLGELTPEYVCQAREWVKQVGIVIGPLEPEEEMRALQVLYLWKDVFVEKIGDLPATDLVTHTIPTYPGAKPYRAKDPIYAADEVRWQSIMLPEMVGTVIQPGVSPWATKTTWVDKKDTTVDSVGRWPLRMVHTYCPLNNATIKTSYPMKRIEPILEDLSRPGRKYFFSADAAYGFYAIPIHPEHAYKSAFNSILGQFYYIRMPMGLTGAPATYARLKDLTFGYFPEPNPEPPVIAALLEAQGNHKYGEHHVSRRVGFKYFCDDDYGAADSFDDMVWFLQEWYFPRIKWAKLTLKPSKSSFFVPRIEPLGMVVDSSGLRASAKKQHKISQFPVPQNEKDIDDFLHLTIYLKQLIPGRTEHARIMKEAVIRDKSTKKKGKAIGFAWTVTQQESFEYIKKAVRDNVIVGGDPKKRYYLAVCSVNTGFGSVLFQLEDNDERKLDKTRGFPKGKERVVQFIAQSFSDVESRYLDVERDCLALLRSLEEVRFLLLESQHPVVVFSDAAALISILGKDDSKGRIAGWRVRISEYDIEPRHAKIKDMVIADGLSRMPYESLDVARTRDKEWEDVCTLDREIILPRQYIPQTSDHLTYVPDKGIILNGTMLVVYCNGACRKGKSSVGVYFGPDNPYNFGKCIPDTFPQTNQVAEVFALWKAMEIGLIRLSNVHMNTLVIATDSEYAYMGVTEWVLKWKRDPKEQILKRIRNASFFLKIDEYLTTVEGAKGGNIKFWRVPRELNAGADRIAGRVLDFELRDDRLRGVCVVDEKNEEDETAIRQRWIHWLMDEWYEDVTHLLLFGSLSPRVRILPQVISDHAVIRRLRKAKVEAKKFKLSQDKSHPYLLYREVNGEYARCILQPDVTRVLHRFHDLHGHFAAGVMCRNMLGKYYWPGRMKDIARWCHTCDSCQRMGPMHVLTSPKMILTLQPMDLLGMDFLGPITPNSRNGSVYILLAVDYFSRYLFAHATQHNTGEVVVRLLEERIARVFGWPLAFYVDNGSHFVKGRLPEKLNQVGTKLITAPISHPRSVGLAERYVQLILAGLRTAIQSRLPPNEPHSSPNTLSVMGCWDEYLDGIVHAINSRVLKVHGFSPSRLFLGFDVRIHPLDETAVESMRRDWLSTYLRKYQSDEPKEVGSSAVDGIQYELRLASLEELRELTRERVMRNQEDRELKATVSRRAIPREGDLVLRRRFVVDKSLGMKLYSKWDGPYRLSSIAQPGVSGYLEDLKTGRILGRYAFNTLKVFSPRSIPSTNEEVAGWVSVEEGLGMLQCKVPREVVL